MNHLSPATVKLIARAKKTPKLSSERERVLLERWQQNRDKAAGDQLAAANLRHVVFTALSFRRYALDVSELIAEGNVGLMHAMDKFNPSHGTRFSTYAVYWIRSHVVGAMLKARSLVGGGSGALSSKNFFRIRRERARVYSRLGEGQAADAELARVLGISDQQLGQFETQLNATDASLDAARSDESSSTLLDTLAVQEDFEGTLASKQRLQQLTGHFDGVFEKLNTREKYILEKRLMAESEEELSLSQLSHYFGVSRERVRQLEQRAKEKIRTHFVRNQMRASRPFEPAGLAM